MKPPPLLTQQALPPYRTRCEACGAVWYPTPARRQTELSDSRLDRLAKDHWRTCPGGTDDGHAA